MASIYAEECAPYPSDAVIDVLEGLGRSQKWWPARSEVFEGLESAVARRREWKQQLEAGIELAAE